MMKMFKVLGFTEVCLSLGLVGACSDDNSSSTNDDGGTGGSAGMGSGGSGASGGSGGEAPTCNGPKYPGPGTDADMGLITGTIQDIQGNPAADILADVCGSNICLSAEADAMGMFSNDGQSKTVTDAHFIYGNGVHYAQMTAPIGMAAGFDFGTINTVALPELSMGVDLAAGSAVTAGTVTIDIPAGATIDYDTIQFPGQDELVFRAVVFTPTDGNFPAIPASANLQGVVATGPMNTGICPGATLQVPNTFGFDAGDQIEVLYHGSTVLTQYAPYGGWAPVALAEVTADGMNIVFKDGETVEELGMFGFRLNTN